MEQVCEEDPDFGDILPGPRASLRQFAIFTTLTEHHGKAWQQWPAERRHPRFACARGVLPAALNQGAAFMSESSGEIDRQLSVARGASALMQDLPVGFDPDGADAWEWRDYLAEGVNIGAPSGSVF